MAKIRFWLLAAAAASTIGAGGATVPSQLPDATADQVTTVQGGPTHHSRYYVSGKRIRTETDAGPGGKMTMIMDLDSQQMWMVMPPPVGCVEHTLKPDPKRPDALALPPAGAKQELLGEETIDGHPTKKYKVTTTIDGAEFVQYQWRANDLNGFPVKTEGADGRYTTEFKNIRLGKPDAKLFTPPADCRAASASGTLPSHGRAAAARKKAE